MKVDELEVLLARMDIQGLFLKPSDLALDTGIWLSYPVPNCKDCDGKCCAQKMDLRLFDIARFMDNGLDEFIQGTFETSLEYYQAVMDGRFSVMQPFPYVAPAEGSIYCRFLDRNHKCSIYKARMSPCRAFPLGIVKDRDGNISLQWFGDQCKIWPNESFFWKLVNNAILNWNEGVKNQLLLMNARDQLREIGFDKYLGNESLYKNLHNRHYWK